MEYICLLLDDCTRYAIAFPLAHKTAPEVARKLYDNVICRYGAFKTLLTDAGREFINEIMSHLSKMFMFQQIHSPGYSPIITSAIERTNQSLINSLRATVKGRSAQWVSYLQSTIFAYNNSLCSSTGLTPFAMVFGRLPTFPHETQFNAAINDFNTRSETVGNILQTQKAMYETLREFRSQHNEKRLAHANKHRKPSPILPGSIVFVKYPPSAMPDKDTQRLKLVANYKGPYIVVDRLDNNTVSIKDLVTNEHMPIPFHLSRLKTFAHFNPALYFANEKCLQARKE
jgi:hypothetical protein